MFHGYTETQAERDSRWEETHEYFLAWQLMTSIPPIQERVNKRYDELMDLYELGERDQMIEELRHG